MNQVQAIKALPIQVCRTQNSNISYGVNNYNHHKNVSYCCDMLALFYTSEKSLKIANTHNLLKYFFLLLQQVDDSRESNCYLI